jgi:uncharacterized protein YlzI (FlbEa/FlbD family)
MAKFIYVTDYHKGFQFLLKADQIESAQVLETRTVISMVNEKSYHLQETLEDFFGLCR